MESKSAPPPPAGYASWLDFAVETFDTRDPSLELMLEGADADRDAMREAARSELVQLRSLAASESPTRLQSALRDVMRVLSAAVAVQPDQRRAIFLIKNEPIPAFHHKTLLQLVQEGRTEDAIGYLESISAGFVG